MKSKTIILLALAVALFILMHQAMHHGQPPLSIVTRAETMSTAERYVQHTWTATEANVFHGVDDRGIRVDTPDAAFRPADAPAGWWRTDALNVGIPYMWGGFDTPESFDAGLRAGKWAGDISTAEKRRLLDDGVTAHAVGIDCSGFVSRCWRLPRSYSTRELTALCDEVKEFAELRPGDIFNTYNAHVRLFAGWADVERKEMWMYEAGSDPRWVVARNRHNLAEMLAKGYTAWRYRGMRD